MFLPFAAFLQGIRKDDTMKIVDAHLHFMQIREFDQLALEAGHENSAGHLEEVYRELGVAAGVVMGNGPLPEQGDYPPFLRYCVGLDRMAMQGSEAGIQASQVEEHLKRKNCVGVKLYPGYNYFYVWDDSLAPIYALAEKYRKPVAIHTGLTAAGMGLLKYSHPLTLDEAAAKWPGVQFVMCHFGNPWLEDAVAVLEKNRNVAADLSGLLEGKVRDWARLKRQGRAYHRMLRGWLEYLDVYDRIMFGTDWPLANLNDYIELTKLLVPREHWEDVFWRTAYRIYGL